MTVTFTYPQKHAPFGQQPTQHSLLHTFTPQQSLQEKRAVLISIARFWPEAQFLDLTDKSIFVFNSCQSQQVL